MGTLGGHPPVPSDPTGMVQDLVAAPLPVKLVMCAKAGPAPASSEAVGLGSNPSSTACPWASLDESLALTALRVPCHHQGGLERSPQEGCCEKQQMWGALRGWCSGKERVSWGSSLAGSAARDCAVCHIQGHFCLCLCYHCPRSQRSQPFPLCTIDHREK